jgi:arylsulfatase A-like enzyme
MARWPGHIKPDSVSGALIGQVDLLSTFAALTHQAIPHQAGPDSLDVLPALLGKSNKGRKSLVEHADALSLIDGDWKVIEASNAPKINRNTHTELGNDPQPQLYNLANDPSEQHDLAAEQPERVRSMLAELQRIRTAGRSRP